jgi:hypothetical protein
VCRCFGSVQGHPEASYRKTHDYEARLDQISDTAAAQFLEAGESAACSFTTPFWTHTTDRRIPSALA